MPGQRESESTQDTFNKIKDRLNNTVGTAAGIAYQKITGAEYGKEMTEKEKAENRAKQSKEHHRPPAPDWNKANSTNATTTTTTNNNGEFLTATAMKSGGGYDADPLQGDNKLEKRMNDLSVQEKKSFAWNDPPPNAANAQSAKKKSARAKRNSDSDSSESLSDDENGSDEEKEVVDDFGMDCEPKDKFRKKRMQKLKKDVHPILDAVRLDDSVELRALLELGGDANETITEDKVKDEYDQIGWTPLLEASNKGRVECIRSLLKFKANANVGCKEIDEKPVHYAAKGGHAQALTKLFKETSIDCFARNRKGATCLHSAAKKGRIESLQIILKQFRKIQEENNIEHDAIDFVDSSGQTALHVAAGSGYEDAVSVLVKAGADASLVDNKGRTAKKVAAKKGYDDLSKVLRKAEKESESRKEKLGGLQVPKNAFEDFEGKHKDIAFSPTHADNEEKQNLFKEGELKIDEAVGGV